MIPIRLIGPAGDWRGLALLDSGADQSLFHREIAELIGLDLTAGKRVYVSGIEGGVLPATVASVRLQIENSPRVIKIEVGFSSSEAAVAILGQAGFFNHFRVCFDRDRGRISLSYKSAKAAAAAAKEPKNL